jgi:hypothetical protein
MINVDHLTYETIEHVHFVGEIPQSFPFNHPAVTPRLANWAVRLPGSLSHSRPPLSVWWVTTSTWRSLAAMRGRSWDICLTNSDSKPTKAGSFKMFQGLLHVVSRSKNVKNLTFCQESNHFWYKNQCLRTDLQATQRSLMGSQPLGNEFLAREPMELGKKWWFLWWKLWFWESGIHGVFEVFWIEQI